LTPPRRAASIHAIVFCSLPILGNAGCGLKPVSLPSVPIRPLRAATLEEVVAAYDGYCKGIHSISASGDLDVRDYRMGRGRRIGVRLVATRGGHLYLKGSVAVMTALEVVADGERFWFQLPGKKTTWTGRSDVPPRVDDDQAPYYVLRPADLTSALLLEPLEPRAGDMLVLEGDREAFSVTLSRGQGTRAVARRRIWLERETLLPLRTRTYDERGDVLNEVKLGDWEGTVKAPHRIVVSRPSQGYEAAFAFERVETNASIPARAFVPRIPEGYRMIEVDGR
jgi:outer membrane lipoprotein-sorting protein